VLAERYGLDTSEARSKSWDEYKGRSFHFVITVCDNARETCPVWPGQPVVAHWSSPDPGHAPGGEEAQYQAFVNVASQIASRAELFCAFPVEKLFDALAVRAVGEEFKL
jgi:protein-tyrosine-phosphatase